MRTNRSIAQIALLIALLCGAHTCALAVMPPAAPSEAEDAAALARAALARLPPETHLGEIKNERLRRAVQATYLAVVALADNRESSKVGELNSRFERAYADVGRETARGEHKSCAANCKALDGEPCLTKCKAGDRKFCGCKLIVFACIVAECVF